MSVTLKLATSLDGRIATASGESRWITGEAAREQVHRLRAEHDAVLVGIGTVLADDPDLTVRMGGFAGAQPARAVLDTRQRLPVTSRLARTARDVPTWVFTDEAPDIALEALGVRIVSSPGNGQPDPQDVVEQLGVEGCSRIMIEGGGQVAASFLRAGLIDAIEWFRAPILLGEEGRPAAGPLGLGTLASAPRFRRIAVQALGDDLWERYVRS